MGRIVSVLILLSAASAWASQYHLPADDPRYHSIEVLADRGLLASVVLGQRPYTEEQVQWWLEEARSHCAQPHVTCATADQQHIEQLARERASRFGVLTQLRGASFTRRAIDDDNGVGRIDARLDLARDTAGLPLPQAGSAGVLSPYARLLESPRAALYVQPYVLGQQRNQPASGAQHVWGVRRAYGRVAVGNVAIAAGRMPIWWGPAADGGLMLNRQAPALDALLLSSRRARKNTRWMKWLGYSQYSLLLANLGPDNVRPYASLVGFAANFRPHRRFEFGFNHSYILGGRTAPDVSWIDPFSEFFFIRAPGVTEDSRNVADHRFGMNFRWRMPIPDTSLHFDMLFEDIAPASYDEQFLNRTGYIVGVKHTKSQWRKPTSFELLYRELPAILYRHSIFRSGYATRGRVLGEPLGPNARSWQLIWQRAHTTRLRTALDLEIAQFASGDYEITGGGGNGPSRLSEVSSGVSEWRYMLRGKLRYQSSQQVALTFQGGYGLVQNANFVSGRTRHHWQGMLSLDIPLQRK